MKAGTEVLGQCSSSVCSNAADTIKTAMSKANAEQCPTSRADYGHALEILLLKLIRRIS